MLKTRVKVTTLAIVAIGLAEAVGAPKMEFMPLILKPTVKTADMGGVPVPSAEALKEMHDEKYVLRASGGRLTKMPVTKTLLPHCPKIGVQGVQVDLGPGGTVYSRQFTTLCTSTDGGRTWSSRPIQPAPGWTIQEMGRWKVLRDGTFICVAVKMGADERAPAVVLTSADEGRTWKKRAEIPLKMKLPQSGKDYAERYCHRGLDRLADDTLIWIIDVRDTPYTEGHGLFAFHSEDHGKTWAGPELVSDWGSEGATVLLPSGRVLATMRYQRLPDPGDGDAIRKFMGYHPRQPDKLLGFKNVFLIDSNAGGRTWTPVSYTHLTLPTTPYV